MSRQAFAVTQYRCDRCKQRTVAAMASKEQRFPASDWALLALTWVDGSETFDLCGQCATQVANGIADYARTRTAAPPPVRLPDPPEVTP